MSNLPALMHTVCPACEARGKTWEGSDPICGFINRGQFNTLNFACATLMALRSEESPHRLLKDRNDDKGTVCVVDLSDGWAVLSYYKDRGHVAQAWFFRDEVVRPLVYGDLHDLSLQIAAVGGEL